MAGPTRPLTPEEKKRLERLERSRRNRRGRINPATMPDRLARTAAFVPRRTNLSTDANFTRIYEVPGYSVVEVKGRELGSQHRDALVALFRLPRAKIVVENPDYRRGGFMAPHHIYYETRTTWRELLIRMNRTQHVNNLMTLLGTFQDIQQVIILVHEGRSLDEIERMDRKRTQRALLANADQRGGSSAVINDISWEGLQLDSEVRVQFGTAVLNAIEKAHLVSINANVQFKLKSDYAKTFWPYIDSQPNHSYIDEDRLAQLAGVDMAIFTNAQRSQFRKDCRQAFNDMVSAGGLLEWSNEERGAGRIKAHRYHYKHALPRQGELSVL